MFETNTIIAYTVHYRGVGAGGGGGGATAPPPPKKKFRYFV